MPAISQQGGSDIWTPFSIVVQMGGSIAPASVTVAPETEFTATLTAFDSDTYRRELPGGGYEYQVFASTAHGGSLYQLNSGTSIAWGTSSYSNGTYTYTHLIRSIPFPNEGPITKLDYYRVTDNTIFTPILDTPFLTLSQIVTIIAE